MWTYSSCVFPRRRQRWWSTRCATAFSRTFLPRFHDLRRFFVVCRSPVSIVGRPSLAFCSTYDRRFLFPVLCSLSQGYVRDDGRAISSLGGSKALAKACASGPPSPPPLEVTFRTADPLARPVRAERAETRGIILRVIRSSRDSVSSDDPLDAPAPAPRCIKPVARFNRAFRFCATADYQHAAAAEDPALAALVGVVAPIPTALDARDVRTVPYPDGPDNDPFRISQRADIVAAAAARPTYEWRRGGGAFLLPPIPAFHDPAELPGDVFAALSSGPSGLRRYLGGEMTLETGSADTEEVTVAWTARVVPPWIVDFPPEGKDVGGNDTSYDAFAAVDEATRARPVWKRNALLAEIRRRMMAPNATTVLSDGVDAFDHSLASRVIARTTYMFASGPFRKLRIRRGVDPRTSPEFAKYQSIEVRFPNEWFEGDGNEATTRKEQAAVVSEADVTSFKAPPSGKYHVYQLCDIDLEEVRQTLEASAITGCDEVASRCNEQLGYLSRAALGRIRSCVTAATKAAMVGADPKLAEAARREELDAVLMRKRRREEKAGDKEEEEAGKRDVEEEEEEEDEEEEEEGFS